MHFTWITQEAVPGSVASNTLDSLRIEANGAPAHTFLTPFGTEEDVDVEAGAVLCASISDYDSGYRVARTVTYTITGAEQSVYAHPYDAGEGYFGITMASPHLDPEPETPADPDPEPSSGTEDPVVDPEGNPDPVDPQPEPAEPEPETEDPLVSNPSKDSSVISPSLAVLFIAAGAALVAVALRH